MTREQAIKILHSVHDQYSAYANIHLSEEHDIIADALDMAMEALRQPYTEVEVQKMQELEAVQMEKAYELGRESAPPKQEWIPVSERLPEKEGLYIVTDDSGGVAWASESFYMPLDDGGAYWDYANVTAWMPLPKPYKGGNK